MSLLQQVVVATAAGLKLIFPKLGQTKKDACGTCTLALELANTSVSSPLFD